MITVGVDGSEGSRRALEFAVGEARLRAAAIHAVCAWSAPVPTRGLVMPSSPIPDDTFAAAGRRAAEETLAEVMRSFPDVEHDLVLREGNAALVLIEESHQSELLVVGSRGRGGFTGLLLGSVSQQCAAHAACPVAIIPASVDHTPA
jgi:nucleotide-binding universal stress UspA family protein